MSAQPKSICLLRLSAIGDVCHAVAMVQRIQRAWPDTKITWVLGKVEAMLIGDLPGIDVVVFNKADGLAGMRKVWRTLKPQHFDVLLHMQVAFRASILSTGIRARRRIGFDLARAKKEFQHWFTNEKIAAQRQAHVLDGFMAFADALGAPASPVEWDIPLSEADKTWAEQQLQAMPLPVVICPAASKAERNWLPDRYAAIADYLAEKGANVLICGGPTEMEQTLADEIVQHCQHSPLNLVGQTSLKQLLAVLAQAELVIGPDTGPTHMAVTQSTPVIGLYAHSNPERTGPYKDREFVVSVYEQIARQQHGAGSDALPWGKRNKGEDLMAQISVEQVKTSIDGICHRYNILHFAGQQHTKH